MPSSAKKSRHGGILNALLPGAKVDRNTNKIVVHTLGSNETVVFNIGGTIFETYKATLRSIPDSPLNSEAFLSRHWRPDMKDYFFDRDPEIFHCVLNYFRTGELHLPATICGPVVKSELEFWGIEEIDVEECCWSRFSSNCSTLESLRKLEKDRLDSVLLGESEAPPFSLRDRLRRKLWRFFGDPTSSVPAQIYSYVSLAIVLLNIFSFVAQTHPDFQVENKDEEMTTELPPTGANVSTAPAPASEVLMVSHPVMFYIDVACLMFFLIEFFLRLAAAPKKCRFVLSPIIIMEILALVPDIVDIIVRLATSSHEEYDDVINKLSFFRILRVFRVLRLIRRIPGLWILFYTFKASINDLLVLLMFVTVGTLVFSSLIFFTESSTQENFSSIPKCFWWAIVTMTTVGYGDMYPVTDWGYLVGATTSLLGVMMIGFTVPVLVNNFMMYYSHTTSIINREKQKVISESRASLRKVSAAPVYDIPQENHVLDANQLPTYLEEMERRKARCPKGQREKDSNANEMGGYNKVFVLNDNDDDKVEVHFTSKTSIHESTSL